eukprot:CAMPEP_0180546838 /NCGR_PEP_ID=MMETSP1036_2-20121128/70768_2 /TAXON_ID=632150 /ORGANISM="Azadinium spinosum, Strain 3D9" /LENGTH=92 /DNA_ID=CAMNT_0022561937 /DNA_START=674 /DNA_END=952 /DNA_ORIENTATION=-
MIPIAHSCMYPHDNVRISCRRLHILLDVCASSQRHRGSSAQESFYDPPTRPVQGHQGTSAPPVETVGTMQKLPMYEPTKNDSDHAFFAMLLN